MDVIPESASTTPPVVDEIAKNKDTRQRVRESHVGLYLITRFAAVWMTCTMILIFCAEALLNTVRINKALAENGFAWVKNNPILGRIHKFYPDGNDAISLITSDLVYVYLFTIAVFTLMRFTYHKALRDNEIELFDGGLTWSSLKNQSLLVRLCWFFSPKAGVHKKFFIFWLGYVLLFALVFSIASLFGVKVYLSPELKQVLFGGGITIAFGLLEDLRFFQKIPPREAIFSSLLALVEGGFKRDISGTIKRISAIASEADGPGTEETIEFLNAILLALKAHQEKKLFETDRG